MFKYHRIEDFDLENRIVGVRVDINSPIINKKIVLSERIVEHSKTILELSEKGAKVVVLAHQGRLGKPDCVSLKAHAVMLSEQIGKKVEFINEVYSKKVEDKIKSMKKGEILLLENLRFYPDETDLKKKGNIILKLENLFDFYVFDAFSVAHRKQTSVIGFKNIVNIAGRVMQKELEGLNSIETTKAPHAFLAGGAKPDDLVELIDVKLKDKTLDLIVLSGVIGEIALHVSGFNIGLKYDFLKKNDFLNSEKRIKDLLNKYPNKFILPRDVAIDVNGKREEILVSDFNDKKNKEKLSKYLIQDVGLKTVDYFNLILNGVGSIYFKGPAGNFEIKNFDIGTKRILKNLVKNKAFKFMGGGHSVLAVSKFVNLLDFDYVSLAGGALVKFLSGEKLPGIEALAFSFEKFDKIYDDFVVVGSNLLDTNVTLDYLFKDINLGDKIKVKSDFKKSLGGGGVNVSIALARLGAKVGYLGKFTKDNYDFAYKTLRKNKVNLINSKISKKHCAKSIVLDAKEGDRVIFSFRGQNSDLDFKDFSIKDFEADNYYFNSLTENSLLTQIKIAKAVKKRNPNSKICYNPSLYLIKSELKNVKSLIKNIDILILNYEEAEEIIGEGSIDYVLEKLQKLFGGILIITDGGNGAYLFDGEKQYFQKALSLKKIVDTSGAGDSFAATFFYFYVKGLGFKKSLRHAAKNSASVIMKKGAQPGLLYFKDF